MDVWSLRPTAKSLGELEQQQGSCRLMQAHDARIPTSSVSPVACSHAAPYPCVLAPISLTKHPSTHPPPNSQQPTATTQLPGHPPASPPGPSPCPHCPHPTISPHVAIIHLVQLYSSYPPFLPILPTSVPFIHPPIHPPLRLRPSIHPPNTEPVRPHSDSTPPIAAAAPDCLARTA